MIANEVRPVRFSATTSWLFISIILLGIASGLYAIACPDEVKEFTRSQWEHSMGKNVLHYWGLAWKRRWLRYACASFYAVGGMVFLVVMAWKLAIAFWYIAGYGTLLPF